MPIIAAFALAACTYGKWWGRDKSRSGQTPYTDGIGGVGAWWGGAGGGSWRSRKDGIDPQEDAEERGGLVEGKWVGEDEKDGLASPTKGAAPGGTTSRWSNLFGGAPKSGQYEDHPDVPFLSVSHAPPFQQDAPFVPPPRSSSTHDFLSRGQVAPQGQSGQYLSAGPWASSSSQRWVQRSGSVRSTLSDKIRARFGIGSAARDDCPSPSVYSPNVEAGQMGTTGAYMGLHSALEEEDEELLDDEKVDYDALLGAARVGHGDLARKYAKGEVTDEQLFAPRSELRHGGPDGDARERYYARHGAPVQAAGPFAQPYRDAPPSFAVGLPSAPSRLQVSPKKSATVLSRAAPETPERHTSGAGDLLFSHESPARNQTPSSAQRRPLPTAPGVSPARGQIAPAFTEAPARIPFRQQAPPQLSRHAGPPRPDVFSAGPTAAATARRHAPDVGGTVGSPMPAFEPAGGVTASGSAFSLDGVDALVFGDPKVGPAKRQSTSGAPGRISPTKERSSSALRDLAAAGERGPAASRDEREQRRKSGTGARQPGMVIPSTVALQASKAPPKTSTRSGSTPTKARPVSAYAQLPTQQQQEQRRVTSRLDLRSTAQGTSSKPRDSLGFDPSFSEAPVLAPLQHPSKVRAAIENIETRGPRAPAQDKGPQHRKTASHDSSATFTRSRSQSPTKPTAPQTLERSTTAGPTTYRRALGRKGLDSDSDDDDDDEEAIATKRRLSTLILNRSKSQTAPLSSEGGTSSSSCEPATVEDDVRRERPLSSDPRRLSMMLRRGSSGAHLAYLGDDDE